MAVTYTGNKVPTMCQIYFTISSVTSTNYVLPNQLLYLSASVSIDRTATLAPMILTIGPSARQSSGVGFAILESPTDKIKPTVYKITGSSILANSAHFTVSVSEQGTLYYVIMPIGVNRASIQQSSIYGQSLSAGVSYGNATTSSSNTIATIQSAIEATGLNSQTSYLAAVYLNSSVGISDIYFQQFKTEKSSNGAGILLAFSALVADEDLVTALSQVLRIQPNRISVLSVR